MLFGRGGSPRLGVSAVQEQGQVHRATGDQGCWWWCVRHADGLLRVAGVVGEPVQDPAVHQVAGGDSDVEREGGGEVLQQENATMGAMHGGISVGLGEAVRSRWCLIRR